MIEKAIKLLAHYQGKRVDKNGDAYILHPIRIALKLDTEIQRTAALLHDILKDTDCTEEILLEEGISQEVIDIINLLTQKDNEVYEDYIIRIKRSHNDDAIRVKKLDLIDSIDLETETKGNKMYKRSYEFLCW